MFSITRSGSVPTTLFLYFFFSREEGIATTAISGGKRLQLNGLAMADIVFYLGIALLRRSLAAGN